MSARPLHPRSTSSDSLWNSWPALAGLSAVFLFEMLDNSILNVPLPTIGRDIDASATALQWITNSYAIVFGGLMLAFGALADKYGRRTIMLIGLMLLALGSCLTVFVKIPAELIDVRALIGVAAAMTTPGTIALAFRLFDEDALRIRAISVITTVGLVGLATGPVVGGMMLAFLPWQALLLVNAPIAVLAFIGIRAGIAPEHPEELHRVPIDVIGALLGTATIVLTLGAPTLFVDEGESSIWPWAAASAAAACALLFIWRERASAHPLIDAGLLHQPLVSSGLAYKAATGLAMAGLGYMISLQLQLDWGWSPLRASLALLPQVLTLLVSGLFVERFVARVGMHTAAWCRSLSVLAGLILYATLGHIAYIWVALTLIWISAGLRVVRVVAGVNVMHGTPENRISIGAAMVDTTDEIASAISIALTGTILASNFVGNTAEGHWTSLETAQFHRATSLSAWILALVASALIAWAWAQARKAERVIIIQHRPSIHARFPPWGGERASRCGHSQ